jgi:hypothetical protein
VVLALGGLEVQREGESVIRDPQVLARQLQSRREIAQRGFVGGRGLGPLPGSKVEPGEGPALRRVGDQAAPEIQVVHQIEDPVLRLLGIRPRAQQPAHRQVHHLLPPGGNQRVCRLLNAVVQEGVAGGGRQDQALIDGLAKIRRRGFR